MAFKRWDEYTDPAIRELTIRIEALQAQYRPLPNGEERYTLWAKCGEMERERRALLDGAGE